ncbi:EG45-like domain containing protein 2 [Striga hermonthica]|uniref:EG45-like domain containing protein 2 n=1 Tax=Striga hermonthica TaxID=68872 RepID=A0A9N7NWX5_STRHE|nr:EG45-like domain containing protein 2 [Striga hermonthica]
MLRSEFTIVSLLWLYVVVLVFRPQFPICNADIGSASRYSPPYTPTACHGEDPGQFPTNRLFAAAGEDIWNNGAACGRQYMVQCISSALPPACVPNQTIQVRIVDRAQTSVSRPEYEGATLVLSTVAFAAIANPRVSIVNIQFEQ